MKIFKDNADLSVTNLIGIYIISTTISGSILGLISAIRGNDLLFFNGEPTKLQKFYINIIDYIIIVIYSPFSLTGKF